ncbi:hypothetical protein [Aquicoccus sp. SU-CL01552]|uniref:hypothetical protein n=1 Tax=Aquicoccus sp. SU-CL01552 TaxID=3127656 RepID=UPI00333EC8F6
MAIDTAVIFPLEGSRPPLSHLGGERPAMALLSRRVPMTPALRVVSRFACVHDVMNRSRVQCARGKTHAGPCEGRVQQVGTAAQRGARDRARPIMVLRTW